MPQKVTRLPGPPLVTFLIYIDIRMDIYIHSKRQTPFHDPGPSPEPYSSQPQLCPVTVRPLRYVRTKGSVEGHQRRCESPKVR
jgi:hypothetical protein